jgi:hypothetical protein
MSPSGALSFSTETFAFSALFELEHDFICHFQVLICVSEMKKKKNGNFENATLLETSSFRTWSNQPLN